MQTKLISQTGLKVRTNCRLGYFTFSPNRGNPLTQAESCNNTCLRDRDKRSWDCAGVGWPQKNKYWPYCDGNMNGKELDRCMSNCWTPGEMKEQRPSGWGGPYNSDLGDKCFNEFIGRYNANTGLTANKAEWENCLATVP